MTPNPPKPKEFKGHTDRVCSICVAGEAEAALLYTGSEDGTVRSWNIDTCEMKKEYKGHKGAVSSIFVSEDNLLSASADKTVIHWNLAGEVQKVYTDFYDAPRSVCTSGETMVVGGVDGLLKVFTLGGEGTATSEIEAHHDVVSCVVYNASEEGGSQLFSGSYDKTIKSWDVGAGTVGQVFQGHDNHVRSIAFGSGGTILFSGARDETVRMWNIADGRPLLVLRMPHMVNAITMAGNNLFCGFVDGRVRVVLVKEVQALLTTFKSENKSVFEAKKKEVEAKLEKQIKRMKKQNEKKIQEMMPKPAEGGEEGAEKAEGDEDEEAAAPEEPAEGGEAEEARIQEMQEKMQQEVEQQAENMRRQLALRVGDFEKTRDRALVVSPALLQDGESRLVQLLPYEVPSVLAMCTAGKTLFIAADNEVIKTNAKLNVINV
mmetsp:Transcript_29952/g.50752  ORF Transcript_29952/g.50752 Transcript_29952/m.50752 type:complete len:432 (+) Transcript_29952:53-1348(+)|eukprot:CAMPEP_0174286466 /NCGR_PEP_ID=MMETSP0809-20121228/11988_1 /TAXON_ID=73025 ORGANISM="Eutreptiella gymnastica-like, Strain CCMP1594" /NCGR_SAMPLE_ID=MMETSP0809 /ASSEMBLY_ACC=CAM_ASM_000658 /LENGTH=431 /DNA_ID=CAMNT_0015382557 /DNA_START=53 /DNA_END=1348 /DNA_ORIENTATION=+